MKKLIVILFLILFLLIPVKAETGNITIESSYIKNYGISNFNSGDIIHWEQLEFNVNTYNYISSFWISVSNGVYSHDFESTTFVINQGGIGNGWISYDKNNSKVYYVFSSDTLITSSPINLTFANPLVMQNVTCTNPCGYGSGADTTTNNPVLVRKYQAGQYPNFPKSISGNYGSVTVSIRGTDSYNISYLPNGLFSTTIIKNPYLNSKYIIHGYNNEYSKETSFTNNNIINAIFTYNDGLFLNATLITGDYSNVLINSTIIGTSTSISGNITTDKSSYNISENILYNYSLSNAICGSQFILCRIKIYKYIDLYTQSDLFITYAANGVYNKTFYIPEGTEPYRYYIDLQYFDSSLGWVSVDSNYFDILSLRSIIQFERKYYNLGETIRIITLSNTSGYIRLINNDGLLKLNESVIANNITHSLYNLVQSDISGTWNVYLYNSTGIEVDNDFTTINFDVVIEPTPITTIPQSQIDSQVGLIDISDALAKGVFGTIDTNNDAEYSDSEVTHVGNKIFSTLLLIAFILLVSGSYYAIKGKRR